MSYINGGAIYEYRKHGQELMGYIRGQYAKKPEEFKAYSFSIDMQKLQAICPAGQLASHTVLQKDGYIGFQFRKSTCVKCSFWNECVGTKNTNRKKDLGEPLL